MYTTYSFNDVSAVVSHPALGRCTITGQGVGSIAVARASDATSHDAAADGSVMVSKTITKNGTATVSLQQTSPAHIWFRKLYDYLEIAPASEWADMTVLIDSPTTEEQIVLTGVSFQKKADSGFQQQGQQVSWALMAAQIDG